MSGFKQFGIGDNDEGIGGKSNRFKGVGGQSYRISFAWWPKVDQGDLDLDAKTPTFTGAQRNYMAGVGYFINQGPEYTKLAGEPPRMAIGTVIINWPLDSKGNLDHAALKAGDFEVQPWIFSQDKYDTFKPIHKEFPFGEHDLTVQCTDTQYQKMTFTPCRNSLLRKIKESAPKHFEKIVQRVASVAGNIQRDIGREMTISQIREKMVGGSGGNQPSLASPDPQTTADIDSIVDNLLD